MLSSPTRTLRAALASAILSCPAVLTCVAATAGAQAPATPTESEPEVAAAVPADGFEEGKRRFQLGEALFSDGKFESALAEFTQAYALLEGFDRRYAVHYNIGLCHEKAGRPQSAAEAYRRYLAEAGPDAEDRAAVEAALTELDAKAAAVGDAFAEAKAHIDQGESFHTAEDFSAALAEFEKAYELLEGHPKRFFVLYNIGRCHERLFRYDLALKYYHRYLQEAGQDAEDRAAVEATLRALESLLGKLVITTNVEAEVWVGDRLMGKAPGEVFVPGGQHTLELRAQGHESVKTEVQLTARETQEHSFSLQQLSDYEGIHPVYFWGSVGVSAAALGAAAVFGSLAKSKNDDGKARPDNLNQEKLAQEIDDLALTADILFGAAGLFAVGAGLLYFMTDWEGKSAETEATQAHIMPVVLRDGAGVRVGGSF